MNHREPLPSLGAGLGYREELGDEILRHAGRIDWIEIITESFLDAPSDTCEALSDLGERFRIVPHGVNLSLGTPGEVDGRYVESLAALVEKIDAPWCSDHLCFTRTEGVDLGSLTPLPRSRALAQELGRKAQAVQEVIGVPFIWENIAHHVSFSSKITEAQFITEFLESCDCGILLDLTNLYINSVNHKFDPYVFLESIPLSRVVQVHLAGGEGRPGILYDTHSRPVPEEVWRLFEHVVSRVNLSGALIERDQDFPEDLTEVLDEVERIRFTLALFGEDRS